VRVYDGDRCVAEHQLRSAQDGWVTVPDHHRALWASVQVERRALTTYEEVATWN